MAWPLTCNPRSSAAQGRPNKELPFELLKDRGSASHQRLVKLALALSLKNFQAVEVQLNSFGAVTNSDQINLHNFPVWSGSKRAVGRLVFIYPTLRAEQPHIIAQWENAFTKILKEW
jgi:hypothetical protein